MLPDRTSITDDRATHPMTGLHRPSRHHLGYHRRRHRPSYHRGCLRRRLRSYEESERNAR